MTSAMSSGGQLGAQMVRILLRAVLKVAWDSSKAAGQRPEPDNLDAVDAGIAEIGAWDPRLIGSANGAGRRPARPSGPALTHSSDGRGEARQVGQAVPP